MGTYSLHKPFNTFNITSRLMLDGNSRPVQNIEYIQQCNWTDAGWNSLSKQNIEYTDLGITLMLNSTYQLDTPMNTMNTAGRLMLNSNSRASQTIKNFDPCNYIDGGWELTVYINH